MEFSVTHEAYVFLCSALAGVFISIIHDIFCAVRKKCADFGMFNDIQDIIFWIIAAIVMFAVVFFANNGEIRWYEFFGVILGAVLYIFTLSRTFLAAFEFILEIFSKIFKFFFKLLLTPLIFLYNIVFKGIVFIFRPLFKLCMKLKQRFKRRLYIFLKLTRKTLKKT